MAKSYSLAGKRTESYALYSRARLLAEDALQKLNTAKDTDEVILSRKGEISFMQLFFTATMIVALLSNFE